jgi:hypothetical protein
MLSVIVCRFGECRGAKIRYNVAESAKDGAWVGFLILNLKSFFSS